MTASGSQVMMTFGRCEKDASFNWEGGSVKTIHHHPPSFMIEHVFLNEGDLVLPGALANCF